MALKKYQEKSVEELKEYLQTLNKFGPKHAFISATGNAYKDQFFGDVPFVCVKIPTGGGKTFVACHSVRETIDTTLKDKMDKGIVLWFTPSDAIKSQTLKKFKDRNDFHRKALDDYFDNSVKIFSNEEALRIRKDDVENNICIIVSSLDAFRKEKKIQRKYKVYKENGGLMEHFQQIGDASKLEKDKEGTVINSLANVIRLHKPLIVVDEGHRTKTKLSIDFLKDLNPSFIIEYTATPRPGSNVLVEIHSSELKEEKMVKLPIILESASQWHEAVRRGAVKRKDLEKTAKKEKVEYIRPIALLQAQQEKESKNKVTVDDLKKFLIEEMKVPEEQIAIKTSTRNDIAGVDLLSKDCKIRYIITVSALAEGWDCPFAYVLISVANIGSKISVEQIIGRVLRLPYVKEKKQEELNQAFVFASARNFNEAASFIIQGLEDNGFSKYDVISVDSKSRKYEFDVSRAVKEDLKIPLIALNGEPLEFGDLIGPKFYLSKNSAKFDFQTHYDNDGRIKIDLKGDDWTKERQTTLKISYKDKNFSKRELVLWLDRKLRFPMIDKKDKMKFIQNAVKYQLETYTLSELSVNRFVFRDCLERVIENILVDHAKKQFDVLAKNGKITLKVFEKFPTTITLRGKIGEKFKKNYYEELDKVNSEELQFLQHLDSENLPNIKFWVRNREKKDPFYIQGWKRNRFYPDFVAVTKKGNVVALEWKGADRVSTEDTQYKVEIAKEWEKLGKDKVHFSLAHNKNKQEVLNELLAL